MKFISSLDTSVEPTVFNPAHGFEVVCKTENLDGSRSIALSERATYLAEAKRFYFLID